MDIAHLHESIIQNLKSYAEFDSAALIYSKNPVNGDFMIHSSRLKIIDSIEKILSELKIKYIKKITYEKNNLNFFVDKQEIAYKILETIYKENTHFGCQPKKDKIVVNQRLILQKSSILGILETLC